MEQCGSCTAYLMPGQSICGECQTPVLPTSTSSTTTTTGRKPGKPSAEKAPTVDIAMPPEKIDTKQSKKFSEGKISKQKQQLIATQQQQADLIIEGLCKYYKQFIRPLEEAYKFEHFATPSLNDIDFRTCPSVLLCGQYSTGKTSFIRYLVEKQVMGSRIGAEPTTDKFTAIMGCPAGQGERVTLGNAAAVDKNLPFQHLQKFGINFLSRFEVATCASPILDNVTFIDTPGVLAGEKQRMHRDYDFPSVIRQFGASASMVLVMFDAHKLDISDEMRETLLALKGCEDKLYIVLNKADGLSSQTLLRVYGSLMWSLGRVFSAPEALRVFIGSFWNEPYRNDENRKLLEAEEAELLSALRTLPKVHSIRMVNEVVKRARQVKTHALIINQLKSNFGFFTSKDKRQKEILQEEQLIQQFKKVQNEFNIPQGDFPKMSVFKEKIETFPIHKFPDTDKNKLAKLDWVLTEGIPQLMRQQQELQYQLQQAEEEAIKAQQPPDYQDTNHPPQESFNPFDEEDDKREVLQPWSVPDGLRFKYLDQFQSMKLVSGKLSGANAKQILQQSGLTGGQLKKIWTQADIDKDGYLDSDEFVLCLYLIELTKGSGGNVPPMSIQLCPPSKRALWLE